VVVDDVNDVDDDDFVIRCIDELYPPQGLDQRIALSRTDGYWPFIAAGEDPPQELVYGEFDVALLRKSLVRSRELLDLDDDDCDCDDENIVFCDLGSGTGRLVLATAALHPNWKLCKGIELLESIHEEALEKVQSCRRRRPPPSVEEDRVQTDHDKIEGKKEDPNKNNTEAVFVLDSDSNSDIPTAESNNNNTGTEFDFALVSSINNNNNNNNNNDNDNDNDNRPPLPLAPIELECGSFADPYSSFYDADILFCFSTAMPHHVLIDLARSIGRQCLPGTIVITTEYKLPSGGVLDPLPDDPDYPSGEYEIELLDTVSGDCKAVGGESTVFLQKVVKSVGTGKRRVRPLLPVSELAYRAILSMEENDTSAMFLRQASNQMAFLGFPESWRPKIE